ncbi:MAG: YoaK family protein [Acidimicrobiales bacterium]
MVNAFLVDVRETLFPARDSRHGPLLPLLVAMTLLTGLVDAFSYLVLGHVFVANMTGNVVFLGFALAGAPGFSIAASLVALVSFWSGALVGGKVGSRLGEHRARLLAAAASVQAAFLAASVVLAAVAGNAVTEGFRYGLIVVLGTAMGLQNATARKLAVPDLTTTVLTQTITGIAADSTLAGGKGSVSGRRLIAVAAMLVGGLIGAALVVHAQRVFPLMIALVVIVTVAATSHGLRRSERPWVRT